MLFHIIDLESHPIAMIRKKSHNLSRLDSVRKVREAYLIKRGQTLEPWNIFFFILLFFSVFIFFLRYSMFIHHCITVLSYIFSQHLHCNVPLYLFQISNCSVYVLRFCVYVTGNFSHNHLCLGYYIIILYSHISTLLTFNLQSHSLY